MVGEIAFNLLMGLNLNNIPPILKLAALWPDSPLSIPYVNTSLKK
jgi:hypothetical protein